MPACKKKGGSPTTIFTILQVNTKPFTCGSCSSELQRKSLPNDSTYLSNVKTSKFNLRSANFPSLWDFMGAFVVGHLSCKAMMSMMFIAPGSAACCRDHLPGPLKVTSATYYKYVFFSIRVEWLAGYETRGKIYIPLSETWLAIFAETKLDYLLGHFYQRFRMEEQMLWQLPTTSGD